MGAGQSSFVILYHRTPFDESKDKNGKRIWVDQKSPNGIIPTLRNLFRSCEKGTWIAWRRVDDQSNEGTERFEMDNPSPFTLCRIPLEDEQISSFYHITSKECFWPILHTFPTYFNVNNANWKIFEEVNKCFAMAACVEADYITTEQAFQNLLTPGKDGENIISWKRSVMEKGNF